MANDTRLLISFTVFYYSTYLSCVFQGREQANIKGPSSVRDLHTVVDLGPVIVKYRMFKHTAS